MTFSQAILFDLQKHLLVSFQIINYVNEDKFSITFGGDDSKEVVMDILIKSDSRLKIGVHTGNFAVDIVELIQCANSNRKQLFVEQWRKIQEKPCCNISVIAGNTILDVEDFVSFKIPRDCFEVKLESFPFYDPDDDNRVQVVSTHVCDLWTMYLSLIPYTIQGEKEGSRYEKTITKHERNPINRQLCLQLKGYRCAVCGMVFEDVYGKIGRNFIEVHHVNPISDMEEDHVVDVINELVPLCSNCHSMVHRRKPPYSVDELKSFVIKTTP